MLDPSSQHLYNIYILRLEIKPSISDHFTPSKSQDIESSSRVSLFTSVVPAPSGFETSIGKLRILNIAGVQAYLLLQLLKTPQLLDPGSPRVWQCELLATILAHLNYVSLFETLSE